MKAALHIPFAKHPGLRAVPEESSRGHLKRLSDVEKALKEQAPSAMFYVKEHVARNTRPECERLLGKAPLGADRADSVPHLAAAEFPGGHTFRVVLSGSRGHGSQ